MGFEGTTLWRVRQRVGTDLLLWPGASVMVVRDDGRVLMGRRLDNGLWAIPGGGAEEGSSFSDTAVTELREEVGLEADPADLEGYACISRPDNHLETYPNGDVTHYFGVWFVLRRWRGDPAGDGEEMGELAWFDVGDPPEPLLRSTRVGLELYSEWLASGRFQAY
ncbi:MAG: NUDIX domain-containing protein [Actinomycetota bacterium]